MDEDYFTMMIAKEKGLLLNVNDDDIEREYAYLEEKRLITPMNWDRFCEEVRDIYHIAQDDCYEATGELFIPNCDFISDLVDEENFNIISLYVPCKENDENREKIDDMVSLYLSRVTETLPYYTLEALKNLGLPCKESGESGGSFAGKNPALRCFYDPFQLKMFGDDLYD